MARRYPWFLLLLAGLSLAGCPQDDDPPDDTDGADTEDTDATTVGGRKDLDEDGVPDAWEKAGYFWDGEAFQKWEGQDVVWYKTDPTRISTDQDPYPDGMEVSGVGLPDSVVAPGNHPLVPAFPNIVAVLEGYEPQILSTITLGVAGEATSATDVARETEESSSTQKATTITASVEVGIGGEVDDQGASATFRGKVSAGYTESDATTEGVSTSLAKSVSEETRTDWSRATTTSSGAAANLSLRVRYRNVGTDTAFDVVPTFNLRIGDRDVATFQPSTQINVLAAGSSYPATADVIEFSSTDEPLTLSMDELALLAGGAPVSLVVNQIDANVVRREDDGTFTQQSWTGYGGAIAAVSARVVLDDRQGGYAEALVYADDQSTSPPVTLGEAMLLAGLTTGGGSGLSARLRQIDGGSVDRDVSEWRLALDDALWEALADELTKPAFNIFDVRLLPGSVVRMHPQPTGASAGIYRTTHDGSRVHVVVVDDVYASGLLEVAGERAGGGGVSFTYDEAENAFISGTLGALATRFTDPLEVWVRNPAAVAAGEEPDRVRVPMTAAWKSGATSLTLLTGRADEGTASGVISKTLDPETGSLVAMGANFGFPRGISLHTDTSGGSWYPQIFAAQDTAEWCIIDRPDLDPRTVSNAEFDACFWQDAHYDALIAQPDTRIAKPVSVAGTGAAGRMVAFRYSAANDEYPDRVAVVRFVQSGVGGSAAFTTGRVDLVWATFKL